MTRWFEFDLLNPQTGREWVLAVLCFWPIAPIFILLRGLSPVPPERTREGGK